MLVHAAERTVDGTILLGRILHASTRLRRINPGRQNIPVLVPERFRDQFQSFAMSGLHGIGIQGIAQGTSHSLRIAEIAHESTRIGERKRSVPALPTRSPIARVRATLIRSPSPKGAGSGCIDPIEFWRWTAALVNLKRVHRHLRPPRTFAVQEPMNLPVRHRHKDWRSLPVFRKLQ